MGAQITHNGLEKIEVKHRDQVCIMSDADRASKHYMADLRHAASEAGIPRRRWVNAIHDALSAFEGEIYTFDMNDWFAPEVADVFGNEDDSARWVSNFAKPRGKQKPIRAFQKNISDRVTLIDLFFRLVYPERAALFGYREAIDSSTPNPEGPSPSGSPPGGMALPGNKSVDRASSFMLCYFRGLGVIYFPLSDAGNPDAKLVKHVSAFLQARAKALGSRIWKFETKAVRPEICPITGNLLSKRRGRDKQSHFKKRVADAKEAAQRSKERKAARLAQQDQIADSDRYARSGRQLARKEVLRPSRRSRKLAYRL